MEYLLRSELSLLCRFSIIWTFVFGASSFNSQTINPEYVTSITQGGSIYFKQNPINSGETAIIQDVFSIPNAEYRVIRKEMISEDEVHYICNLFFSNIKVEGYDLAVHIVGDSITGSGSIRTTQFEVTTVPVITGEDAIDA